jgi:hypothetical protein
MRNSLLRLRIAKGLGEVMTPQSPFAAQIGAYRRAPYADA